MSKRILVVDDSPYVADAFARLISHCGYETKTVYSGHAAIQQTTVFRPDMVLMDIGMADLDGYETARQIRSEPENADVVLVAVTCLAQKEDKQRAFASGFHFHVPKPVGLSTLYGLLAKLNGPPRSSSDTSNQAPARPRTLGVLTSAKSEPPKVEESPSRTRIPIAAQADRPLTMTQFENVLDRILRSNLPDTDQRKAVEELFTQYAATLPNF
jgi:CheY-like chemotaxis protein